MSVTPCLVTRSIAGLANNMSKHMKVPKRTPKSVSKNTASGCCGLFVSYSS